MSSLVAYDDSDSETDTGQSEDALRSEVNLANPTMTTVGSRSGFDAVSERRIQSVDYTAGSKKNVFHDDPLLYHVQADKKSSAVAHPAALQMATCSPGQWLSPVQKPRVLSENENYSQKRAHGDCEPTLPGLRPYIPKRLRQEKDPKDGGDSASNSANLGAARDGMSIEISKYIMPYIGSKYGVTAIPTSLMFHMSEHRDPVNVVRWCPVQKWGHMLLSASMDKTVKGFRNWIFQLHTKIFDVRCLEDCIWLEGWHFQNKINVLGHCWPYNHVSEWIHVETNLTLCTEGLSNPQNNHSCKIYIEEQLRGLMGWDEEDQGYDIGLFPSAYPNRCGRSSGQLWR